MCSAKVLTWTCALQTMVIATTYRGNTPVFFTTRYVLLKCRIILLYCTTDPHLCCRTHGSTVVVGHAVIGLRLCPFFFLRTPSIMSCSTTASTARRWTTFCTRVTSLRKPRRLHPAAWWPKSRALSVSTSQSVKTLNWSYV